MLKIINYSKEIFFNKKAVWNKVAERAMRSDFSWTASTKKYEALYNNLLAPAVEEAPVEEVEEVVEETVEAVEE